MPDIAPVARALAVVCVAGSMACASDRPTDSVRASGHVEATDVRVAPEVGGRLLERLFDEGTVVKAGDVIARLDTRDTELALAQLHAERNQAEAQLRLLKAGSRPQEVQQATAQAKAAEADIGAAEADLKSAEADLARYQALLDAHAGSRKQRDDAVTRRDVAQSRLAAARERARAAHENLDAVRVGPRRQEIEAAAARLAAVDARIAALEKQRNDATVIAPVSGTVTEKLADRGELLAPRTPICVISDLDHAWAEVFVDEPSVPRLKIGQAATVFTDAGGPGLAGKITYISPKAEFTPRNVQTAEERSRLVYRVKVTVDNRQGVLKPGMPVEAELPFQ